MAEGKGAKILSADQRDCWHHGFPPHLTKIKGLNPSAVVFWGRSHGRGLDPDQMEKVGLKEALLRDLGHPKTTNSSRLPALREKVFVTIKPGKPLENLEADQIRQSL